MLLYTVAYFAIVIGVRPLLGTDPRFSIAISARALPLNNEAKLRRKFRNAGTHYLINRYKALIVSSNDSARRVCGRNDLSAS